MTAPAPVPLGGVLDEQGQQVAACPRCPPGGVVPLWLWEQHQTNHDEEAGTAPVWSAQAPPPPAHDIGAERTVLHCLFWSAEALEAAAQYVEARDFYKPAHQVVFGALLVLRSMGHDPTPVTVWEYVDRELGEGQALGGSQAGHAMLVDLWSTTGHALATPDTAAHHAKIVRERSLRRDGVLALTQAMQAMAAGDGDVLEVLGQVAERVDWATRRAADEADPLAGPVDVGTFTSVHRQRRPWVIAGLVRAGDRVLIVGPEGGGKSTLNWQVATMACAGLHPFTYQAIPPQRVLIIDLENNRDDMQDTLAHMVGLATQYAGWDPKALTVWHHPQGLDLRSGEGQYRLAAAIRKARPALVVAGPVWKMARTGKDGHEAVAWDVSNVWDRLRAEHHFALWMETHPLAGSPGRKSREWRPKGGELWQAWPEAGMSLVPAGKGEPEGSLSVRWFRGQRGHGRVWPERFTRRTFGAGWPWEAVYPAGTLFDRDGDGRNGGWGS